MKVALIIVCIALAISAFNCFKAKKNKLKRCEKNRRNHILFMRRRS